ncbi:MAG TPA: hypothetical protein VGM19_13160 [Armatimonadota bacterium]|jgi:hypothetical protein
MRLTAGFLGAVLLTLLLSASLAGAAPAAAPAALLPPPDNSLWIDSGKIKSQGPDLVVPAELTATTMAARLWSVGPGQVVWTEEQRDAKGVLQAFGLNLADVKAGTSQKLVSAPTALGDPADWRLEAVSLAADKHSLLARVRLTGTGYQSEVYSIALATPFAVTLLDSGTVWDGRSADGSRSVAATWMTTSDGGDSTEAKYRYGDLLQATTVQPAPALRWAFRLSTNLQPWADRYITAAAVSPDGTQIAYVNPRGLWLVSAEGALQPSLRMGTPAGATAPTAVAELYQVLWSRDGTGLYVSFRRVSETGPSLYLLPLAKGAAQMIAPGAASLCLVTITK